YVTGLPICERHSDLHCARPELFADTHGVVKARASTAFAESKVNPDGRTAGFLRWKLHYHFRLKILRDRLVQQVNPRTGARTRRHHAGRQFESIRNPLDWAADLETHSQVAPEMHDRCILRPRSEDERL